MAIVTRIKNPFKPFDDLERFTVESEISIRAWLTETYKGFTEFSQPTVCIYNGNPLLRKDWDSTIIRKDDAVVFIPVQGTPVVMMWICIAMMVVSIGFAIYMRSHMPSTEMADNTEGDTVYSLKGQKNQIRLGDPIEVQYGRCRRWPSYAAAPYVRYENNDQYLYQLFTMGQGSFAFEEHYIEDTPLSQYQEVQYEIIPPGGSVSLFPTNIQTSSEVSNIEMFANNENKGTVTAPDGAQGNTGYLDGASGHYKWVTTSEGDPENNIPSSGNWGAVVCGPFVAVPPSLTATKLEVDIAMPGGLYTMDDKGALIALSMGVLFQYQQIDANDNPVGDWQTLQDFSISLSTNTTQRFTLSKDVPAGRYRVQGWRTTAKDTSTRAANTVMWEQLRAFLPDNREFGEITLIALKAKATNNLSESASHRYNNKSIRKIPVYNNATQTWAEMPTRSLVWAMCDIFRNSRYGGRLDAEFLDLEQLSAMDTQFTNRGEFFDYVFDAKSTVWEAARVAASVARAVPILNGSRVTLVRDEPKTAPVAVFTEDNIVRNSFKWDMKFSDQNDYDGLRVEYTNAETWKPETVLCTVGSEQGDNPDKVTAAGITDRAQAYHFGMYKRAVQVYLRETITFKTGLEGYIPAYGDLIAVQHFLPKWGQGGRILAIDPARNPSEIIIGIQHIVTDVAVKWTAGQTHYFLTRTRNGTAVGPFVANPGSSPHEILISGASDFPVIINEGEEYPQFIFGSSTNMGRNCLVSGLRPDGKEEVEITAIPYDERVYQFDSYVPPADDTGTGGRPKDPDLPSVSGLTVHAARDSVQEVVATWVASSGSKYYIVQLSYDSIAWETVGDQITDTSCRFSVKPTYIYVRVCAVNVGAGNWAYWTGFAPVEKTNVDVDVGIDPDAVTNITIASGVELLILRWSPPTNTKVAFTDIYHLNADGSTPLVPAFSVPFPSGIYFHAGLTEGTTHAYRFQAVTSTGRKGPMSAPFSSVVASWPRLDDVEHTIIDLNALVAQAQADADNAYNQSVTNATNLLDTNARLTSTSGTLTARIASEETTRANADSAMSSTITALDALVKDPTTGLAKAHSLIASESSTRASADSSMATSISSLTASINDGTTGNAALSGRIVNEQTVRANADTTLTNSLTSLQSTVNDPTTGLAKAHSRIDTESSTRATQDSALSTSISNVSATANTANSTANSAVTQASTAQAGVNSLSAEWVMNVVVNAGGNKRVAGIRITNQGGGSGSGYSDLVLQADKIGLVNSSGNNQVAPFALVNDIAYLNTAVIQNASITSAMIQSLVADKISAGVINVSIAMLAASIGSGSQIVNPALPTSNGMPVMGCCQDEVGDYAVTNDHPAWNYLCSNGTFLFGWTLVTSGYYEARFGKTTTRFLINVTGNATNTDTGGRAIVYGTAYRTRPSGGTWSAWTGVGHDSYIYANGDKSINRNDVVVISGLTGSTDIQFGFRVAKQSGGSGMSIGGCYLTAMSFNL